MKHKLLLTLFVSLAGGFSTLSGETVMIENSAYKMYLDTEALNVTLEEKSSGKSCDFSMNFLVLQKGTNEVTTPNLKALPQSDNMNYPVVSWSGRFNLFSEGSTSMSRPTGVEKSSTTLFKFSYENNNDYLIESELSLPEGSLPPILTLHFTPQKAGAFSIGYYGAESHLIDDVEELWQPMVWTDRIMPTNSYMTPASLCTLPGTMARVDGCTYGVMCDTWQMQFTNLPNISNSSFGVALRNQEGEVQPMIFAPILGGSKSKMEANQEFKFNYRLIVSSASIAASCKEIAQNIYLFDRFPRNNRLCSLNETFENMVDYGMSEYSRFNEEYKASSYETDVNGAVRNTSALHPFNVAFITDNADIFGHRAMPVIEFMLSRNSDLFSLNPTTGSGGQAADNKLGVPSIRSSEAAVLYQFGQGNMAFLQDLAISQQATRYELSHEKMWRDNMALYRATNDENCLTLAKSGADLYIDHRLKNNLTAFNYLDHSKSSFWSSLNPKWIELFEMYETTGEQRYLDAAYEGALRFCRFLWQVPVVPDTKITVNKGGKAPVYNGKGAAMSVPEETVDAWALSEVGLHPEAGGTCSGHRAVFMAHHAPYLLRIAALKDDDYLRRMARSAIIGRYRTFPGYHINTARTTVYEKADFPYHAHDEITCTSMHYSHVWPMISLMVDYLISDAEALSAGNIHFPSQFIEAFSYLQGRTYFGSGKFYDLTDAVLYMPKQLLTGVNQQLNYIAARSGDKLCLAFVNQSEASVSTTAEINTSYVENKGMTINRVYTNNISSSDASIASNQISLTVPAGGMVAVIVNGCEFKTNIQDDILAGDQAWKNDFVHVTGDISGKAMILNFGKNHKYAYIYSSDEKGTFQSIDIHYSINGQEEQVMSDKAYPFEFEIKLPSDATDFQFRLVAGNKESEEAILSSEKLISATISKDPVFAVQGEAVNIPVSFTGESPWQLSYEFDGKSYEIKEILKSPYIIKNPVTGNSRLRLTSVSDNSHSGIVSSHSKEVYAADRLIDPVFDTYVQEKSTSDYSSKTLLELKNATSWSREVFVSFDLSDLTDSYEAYGFRINLASLNIDNVNAHLEYNNHLYDNDLTWTNRNDESFELFSSKLMRIDDLSTYWNWDITDLVKEAKKSGNQTLSFRFRLPGASDAFAKLSSAESDCPPALICVTDKSSSIKDHAVTPEIKIVPNPVHHELTILNAQDVESLEIYTLAGSLVKATTTDAQYHTITLGVSDLAPGMYLLICHKKNDRIIKKFIHYE